jgi:hypothetical protein
MKVILSIVSIVILSYSCQVSKQDIDISDYCFNLNKFDSPKIYRYISEANGFKAYLYSKLTKTNNKDLLLEQFDGSFKITNRTIMEYTLRGIKYKEVWVSNPGDKGNLYRQSIIDSLVFPFNLKDSPIEFKSEGRPNGDMKIISTVRNQFSEPKDTVLNGFRTKIIYGHAERTWKVTSSKMSLSEKEIKAKDLVIYQNGMGIILLKTYNEKGEIFKMEFDKILTVEEFEEKRKCHQTNGYVSVN